MCPEGHVSSLNKSNPTNNIDNSLDIVTLAIEIYNNYDFERFNSQNKSNIWFVVMWWGGAGWGGWGWWGGAGEGGGGGQISLDIATLAVGSAPVTLHCPEIITVP